MGANQQGQHTQGHVRADPVRRPVKDGPGAQAAFDGVPALLDTHQLLVARVTGRGLGMMARKG